MLITVALEALTGAFSTDIDRAAKKAEKDVKSMQGNIQRSLAGVSSQFKSAAAALGVTLSVAGLAAFVKSAINAADHLSLLAQQTGISTEALSELQYAAQQSGIEDLSDDLIKFNKNIAAAAVGSKEQAGAFKAIGVAVTDAQGNLRGTEQILSDVADAFAGLADGPAKTALAMQIFGKAGAELIPLLNGGASGIAKFREEAHKLGLTIGTDTANAANDFNDSIDRIKASVTGISRQIVTDLTPNLKDFAEFMQDPATIQNLSKFGEALVKSFEAAVKGVAALTHSVSGFYDFITSADPTELVDVLDEIARVNKELQVRKSGSFLDQFNASAETVDELNAKLTELIKKRDELFEQQRKQLQEPAPAAPGAPKPQAPTVDPDAEEKGRKALEEDRRLQEARARGADEIFQAQQDREKAILEASLNANLITYQDYLEKKLALTDAEIDQEIESAKSLLDNAKADEKALLEARIKALEIRKEIAQAAHDSEGAQHARDTTSRQNEIGLDAASEIKDEVQAMQEAEDRKTEIFRAAEEERFRIQQDYLASGSAALGDAMAVAAALGKKGFKAFKAFAVAQALVDTYASATAAFKSLAGIPYVGPALGIAAAGAAVGAGLARVAVIESTEPTGYAEGGWTGSGAVHDVAGVVHGQEFVVKAGPAARNRSMLEAMNDGRFDAGTQIAPGGGSRTELVVNNYGEPMQVRITRERNKLIADLVPLMADATETQIATGITSGSGKVGQAVGNKFGLQGRAIR